MRAGALLAGLLAACTLRPIPPVTPLPTDSAEAWAAVLRDDVDDAGRVAFRRLRSKPEPLTLAVAAIAHAEPGATPAERLAFAINSYNTLAMYAVVNQDVPIRLSPLDRVELFRVTRFDVAGRSASLRGYGDAVLRSDPRARFALSCMAVSCPALARIPYDAAGLDAELDAAARRFLSDPLNVRFDPATHTVRLSPLLQTDPAPLQTVNRYRVVPVPPDARVAFGPFDWTVIDQLGDQTTAM